MIIRFAVIAALLAIPNYPKADDKLPFEGKWAVEKSLCNAKSNPTGEGVHTLTANTYKSLESSCKIAKKKVIHNSTYQLTLACMDEGEMGNSILNIGVELNNPAVADTSWGKQEKDQGTYYRCR